MEWSIQFLGQNHVNSGFSWGKLVVMIWTMKRWDMKQEVCNGDMKQQTTGMWTDNHGTWNNINMNKSMWWFRAITSLGVNKWIMKCQKHETNFPFGFFSWTLQAPIICLVWSLDSDGHYFPRHEMPGIEVVTRTAWGGDGRGWLCSSTGVFLGVPSQVVPSSKTSWGLPEKCRLREWSCSAAWQKGLSSATTVPVPAEGFDIGMGKPQT